MKFRMGLTIGDVVERDGDLLGDGVNIAARLQSIAPEGGICISRSIHEAVANKLSVKFLDKGMQQLKNIPEPMQAYTVGPSVSGSDADPALGNSATSSKQMLRSKMSSSGRVLAIAAVCVASIAAIAVFTLHKPEIANPDERQKVAAAQPAPVEATSPKDAKDLEKVSSPPSADPAASETPSAVVKAPAASAPRQIDPIAASTILNRRLIDCNEAPLDKAVAPCRAVLDLHLLTGSELAAVQLRLGRALRESGDAKAAIEMLSQSINQKPTADAYNHRGIAYFDDGIPDKSIADYTEAIRLEPKNAEALNNRAWTKFKSGDLKTALEDADQAVTLLATKSYVWDTRGHVHEALGNRSLAVKDFRQALSLDPANAASKSGLERLGDKP